jgi:pimeloyl-ACP methyl ester carboxylesterase
MVRMSRIRGTARAFQRSLRNVINLSGQYVQTIERAHEIPTLPAIGLFWGTEDPVIPIRHGTELLDRFTGVTLTAYPGCGHFPHLDVPCAFARELCGFLAEPNRSGAFLLPRPHDEERLRATRVLAACTSK